VEYGKLYRGVLPELDGNSSEFKSLGLRLKGATLPMNGGFASSVQPPPHLHNKRQEGIPAKAYHLQLDIYIREQIDIAI
jgi:hypothetical protein